MTCWTNDRHWKTFSASVILSGYRTTSSFSLYERQVMEFITSAEETAAQVSKVATTPLPRGYNFAEKVIAYLDLTKPRITFLVVFSSLAGFALGSSSPINWRYLFQLALGIGLLSS